MDEHEAAPKHLGTIYELAFTHGQVHYLLALLERERDAHELDWGWNRNSACLAKLAAALKRDR
jgi:hypothetical protein